MYNNNDRLSDLIRGEDIPEVIYDKVLAYFETIPEGIEIINIFSDTFSNKDRLDFISRLEGYKSTVLYTEGDSLTIRVVPFKTSTPVLEVTTREKFSGTYTNYFKLIEGLYDIDNGTLEGITAIPDYLDITLSIPLPLTLKTDNEYIVKIPISTNLKVLKTDYNTASDIDTVKRFASLIARRLADSFYKN